MEKSAVSEDKLHQILNDRDLFLEYKDKTVCSTFEGLKIIYKYLPNRTIEFVGNECIYSAYIPDLLDAEITEDDCIKIREFGGLVDNETGRVMFFV